MPLVICIINLKAYRKVIFWSLYQLYLTNPSDLPCLGKGGTAMYIFPVGWKIFLQSFLLRLRIMMGHQSLHYLKLIAETLSCPPASLFLYCCAYCTITRSKKFVCIWTECCNMMKLYNDKWKVVKICLAQWYKGMSRDAHFQKRMQLSSSKNWKNE